MKLEETGLTFEDIKEKVNKYMIETYERMDFLAESAKDQYIYNEKGEKYLDFYAGIAVNSAGSCNEKVVKAVVDQAQTLMHTFNYPYTIPQALLAEKVCTTIGMDTIFFQNSGTEANEAMIKLARKYGIEKYGPNRYHIVTAKMGFHGRTFGAMSATGQPGNGCQVGFGPMTYGFSYAPYNDLKAFKDACTENTIAIMVEPVQGEGGVHPATMEFMKGLDWSPLLISLKTGVVATSLSFFGGIYAARQVVKAGPKTKAVLDGILTLPMVLPPTVAGFFLLLIFSLRRPFGAALYGNFGIKVVQTWLGCILAATVIAFPLMYRNARAAFEQIDANLVYAARTLGMSEMTIFWKVVIPSAGPGILSGTILTFARAMGEYGATSMLAGNIPGKTGTISQKIAMVIQDGDYGTAGFWVLIIMIIAFVVVLVMNLIGSGGDKHKKRW